MSTGSIQSNKSQINQFKGKVPNTNINLAAQVRLEMEEKKKKKNKKVQEKRVRLQEVEEKKALIKEHGNKYKDDMPGIFAVYPGDWRDIRLSSHVKYSHKRLGRYAKLKPEDYIVYSVYEPLDGKISLFMSSRMVLVVGLNENNSRKLDKVITVLNGHYHLRKFTILEDSPIVEITNKVTYD